mmetsp:Transcript_102470/g.289792  ORF Transcript_102470/g.289792 Transcript_102470/m.289792 type:complete len:266 (-) Transcript_102470:131-928(-)|eukprot:CAMPEP_0168409142 /NCGR_PEP_ID=MMETSP0228-20121227/27034_1 /TAXON_ID=133427 /ORGANISM="Protoceratium reticulatum, Strain CCCM 535 (=CCMP 1889)" /LENGTH=265 /DNA_ID=CAMNT_0008422851 /DNA_START=18 /DNA_END=815 /DNA_ORIENTATION=+
MSLGSVLWAALFLQSAAGGGGACERGSSFEDALVLAQVSSGSFLGSHSKARWNMLGALAGFDVPFKPINCTKHPVLCQAPFNCNSEPITRQQVLQWGARAFATNGHANLKSWCMMPWFADSIVQECLVNKNLQKSAQMLFEWTVRKGMDETDGSYCFIEGHCANQDVTYNTTLEEAERICDARYGHRGWAEVPFAQIALSVKRSCPLGQNNCPFFTKEQTTPWMKSACVQGNFHCDVIYCKETYCKIPHYIERYGHFLKDFGYTM